MAGPSGPSGPLKAGSLAALIGAAVLLILAGPGKRPALSADQRAPLCGADCYPAAHPWLLILAGALAVAGLIGLRMAFKGAR